MGDGSSDSKDRPFSQDVLLPPSRPKNQHIYFQNNVYIQNKSYYMLP